MKGCCRRCGQPFPAPGVDLTPVLRTLYNVIRDQGPFACTKDLAVVMYGHHRRGVNITCTLLHQLRTRLKETDYIVTPRKISLRNKEGILIPAQKHPLG